MRPNFDSVITVTVHNLNRNSFESYSLLVEHSLPRISIKHMCAAIATHVETKRNKLKLPTYYDKDWTR